MPQRPTQRLFVHVGLQKTGTSYLQALLLENAAELGVRGLDLVPATKREAFELMLVVRGRHNPERDPASAAGALDRFTESLAASTAPAAVLSQESLAAARPDQLRRLLDACGEHEVHCVVTARDLARGIPSSWQQELKSGRTPTYEEWLERLQAGQEAERARHPWIHLDPVAVLERWSEQVPSERLHLVTVPPAGSSPTLLLERFFHVLGVDPTGLGTRDRAANTSLGREQAELLRLVNGGLSQDARRRQVYGDVGKRYFASRILAAQPGRRIRVPEARRAWVQSVSEQQVAALAGGGYDVVGDLADLRPGAEAFSEEEQAPDEAALAHTAIAAVTAMLELRASARASGSDDRGEGRCGGRPGSPRGGLLGRALRRVRRLTSPGPTGG